MQRLSTDPDTIRIPAFMRKRTIRSQVKKPLVLTALDRKNAGIVLPELQKIKKSAPRSVARRRTKIVDAPVNQRELFVPILDYTAPARPARTNTVRRKVAKKVTPRTQKRVQKFEAPRQEFSSPLQDFAPPIVEPNRIGEITHYYAKIKVGVIKLSASLSVGDSITYQTEKGDYTQKVDSMEIDRVTVFQADAGDEIGIKLKRAAKVGSSVIQ